MSAPKRIQLSRKKGWRKPEGAVVVARPSKWGNPFRYRTPSGLVRYPAALNATASWEYEGRISAAGMQHDYYHPDGRVTRCHVRYATRAELVTMYADALIHPSVSMVSASPPFGTLLHVTVHDVVDELSGRDLACWCPLEDEYGNRVPCHADVLLEIANIGMTPEEAVVHYRPEETT